MVGPRVMIGITFAQKLLIKSIVHEEETNLELTEEELRRADAKQRADLEKKTASLRARTKAITDQLAKDKEMIESIALEKLRKDKEAVDEKMKKEDCWKSKCSPTSSPSRKATPS